MKKRIWKYQFGMAEERFTINVPHGAMFLSAQVQKGKPVMWAVVSENVGLEPRNFVLLETGAVFDHEGVLRFIATLQIDEKYVVHLFEEEK